MRAQKEQLDLDAKKVESQSKSKVERRAKLLVNARQAMDKHERSPATIMDKDWIFLASSRLQVRLAVDGQDMSRDQFALTLCSLSGTRAPRPSLDRFGSRLISFRTVTSNYRYLVVCLVLLYHKRKVIRVIEKIVNLRKVSIYPIVKVLCTI